MRNTFFIFLLLLFASCLQAQTYQPLWIPDTLSGTHFKLVMKDTFKQIVRKGNQTVTGGINSNFWGPTLFVNKGDVVEMEVHNQLNDSSTLHWHGFHLPAVMDGGPYQVIPPGAIWRPYWKVTNHAATYWFHPHLHEMTHEHIAKGLGGLIIVRDEIEKSLQLPRTYGIDDIPLVLTDRDFDKNNQMLISPYGDSALVNGTLRPEVKLPAQIVRFRILDAAITRSFMLGFADNRKFWVITSDGGLLNAPVQTDRYLLHAAERVEILVDLSKDEGKSLDLLCYNSELKSVIAGGDRVPFGPLANYLAKKDFKLLHINVNAPTKQPITSIPNQLTNNILLQENEASVVRKVLMTDSIVFQKPPLPPNPIDMFILNHKIFELHHNNFSIPLGNTEIWEITNASVFGHPFHIHDVTFNVLSVNGEKPDATQAGWKDVVFVPSRTIMGKPGVVRFIAKFEDYADDLHPFMYHCHIATHEDEGMMGQFVVKDKVNTNDKNIDNEQVNYSLAIKDEFLWVNLENPKTEVYYLQIKNEAGLIRDMLPLPRLEKGVDISHLSKGKYTVELTAGKSKKVYTQTFTKL
ncbi:MAG: multicopper oxidase family protein [Bacteroidia bacterium]